MNIDTILRLLTNSGFHGLRADADFVYMEDPSCIIRSFEIFMNYAWIVITALTGFLLVGWGISKIRGAKDDLFSNLKNLMMLFIVLSVAKPVINLIYGDDLFEKGCRTISIPIKEINKLLAAREDTLKSEYNDLYEGIDIYDSGIIYEDLPVHQLPYSVFPVSGSGQPADVTQMD